MNKKGFAALPLIIISALIILAAGGIFYFNKLVISLKEYIAPDKTFSVLMPPNPVAGNNMFSNEFTVSSVLVDKESALSVSFIDYPSKYQTGNQDEDLQNFGKGLSPQLTNFSNYRAVDYSGQITRYTYIKGRAIIVGNRFYKLFMTYTDPTDYNESVYNQFINSFKILSS